MPIAALFDFNLDGEDSGYEATNGESLSLSLRDPSAASTVLFQVYDPAGPDPELGIAANPPRASKGAATLTLVGATSGQAVSPTTVAGAVTCAMPGSGSASWIVRCVVNGGRRQLANGTTVVDTSLIFERGVFIPAGSSGIRKVVHTERTQFETDGWAGVINDIIDAAGGGGIPAGSYDGQPVKWDGAAYVPVVLGDPLVFDNLIPGPGGILDIYTSSTLRLWGGDGECSYILSTGHVFFVDAAQSLPALVLGKSIADEMQLGVLGALPVVRQSITGATVQEQIDSTVAALVAFGFCSDDR